MNRLQIIRFCFQCIFVVNCIVIYGYLMRNSPEQEFHSRNKNAKDNICYSHQKPKANSSRNVEDILSMPAPVFDKRFKNPCFYEVCNSKVNKTKQLRCVPYFQLLGVDKCGSTDLFHRLTEHPHVLGNVGSLQKETMWWSWRRYGLWLSRYKYPKETFSDYLGYFYKATVNISSTTVHDDVGPDWHPLITGDGTPMDFWDFTGWRDITQNKGLDHPEVLTPHLLHHINPNVKLIIILRNPTQRLYSDYMFLKLGRRTGKGFHDEVGFSMSFLKHCMKNRTIESCVFDGNFISMLKLHLIPIQHWEKIMARIHVGLYSIYLKEWLKVFNKNQILILTTEDYSLNIKETLGTVFKFLELEELPNEELERIAKIERVHKTEMKRKQGPMHKRTKDILEKFYKPYNEELAQLLHNSKFLWN